MRAILPWLAALSAALLAAGCYTPPEDAESDIPWNTPQSWEGSPYMPGYSPEQ